jgi:cytidylate kinase
LASKSSIVTIDGPAGAGKSSVARGLATLLGFRFLDTGAMYRALTWAAMRRGVEPVEGPAMSELAESLHLDLEADGKVLADGADVTHAIRDRAVTARVSAYAALPSVRAAMQRSQRTVGARGRLVCEGRDMGTHVFPDAAVKFYLDASSRVRAERRRRELAQSQQDVSLDELVREIDARDLADSQRAASPLRRAADQIYLDSSGMTQEEVLRALHEECARRLAAWV